MRSLLHVLLACMTLACPFLCGAEEFGHGERHEHAGRADAPIHCPDNGGDNCVCRGAVQTGDVRAQSPYAETSTPFPLPVQPLQFTSVLHHCGGEGAPAGLADWGDSLAVRAFLQNFRF